MTSAVGAARIGHSGIVTAASVSTCLALLFTSGLWAFCHPYAGIQGDANAYMGRVLADLDPAGVGRDMMFVYDGQSQFSLFPVLARPLVAYLGVAKASLIIAALGSACWFTALVALAHALAKGRMAWAIVVFVALLPIGYGEPGVFSFGETLALPRPFAEAALLAALAALLTQRPLATAILLTLAVLLHPIMAASGVAVAAIWLLWRCEVRTRLVVIGVAAMLVLLLGILGSTGVPGLDRLVATMDADWYGLVHERSPHLFPLQWSANAFLPIVAQATTLVIAARCVSKDRARLLLAIAFVALAAVMASVALSDTLHLTLFVQTQAWRATWLLAVFGGCGLAICVPALWQRDTSGRLVLAALALLWFCPLYPPLTYGTAVAALLIDARRLGANAKPVVVVGAYLVAVFLIFGAYAGPLLGYFEFLKSAPANLTWGTVAPLRNNLHTLPLVLLAGAWLVSSRASKRFEQAGLAISAPSLFLLGALAWNQDPPDHAVLETPQAPLGFATLGAKPTEVLWLDSRGEPWFALQRPQYLSPQQAVSIVFSRTLAMEWRRRAAKLVALGLAQKNIFTPLRIPADDDRARVTPAAVDTLCRDDEAPSAIFAPILDDDPSPPIRGTIVWLVPQPIDVFDRHETQGAWHRIKAFAIIPCRAHA